jgi:hypothetical protein
VTAILSYSIETYEFRGEAVSIAYCNLICNRFRFTMLLINIIVGVDHHQAIMYNKMKKLKTKCL